MGILPPAYNGSSDVRVQVFTLAFRKIQDTTFPGVPEGTAVTVRLADRFGTPLANGLYYVAVQTSRGRSVSKLLVLR